MNCSYTKMGPKTQGFSNKTQTQFKLRKRRRTLTQLTHKRTDELEKKNQVSKQNGKTKLT